MSTDERDQIADMMAELEGRLERDHFSETSNKESGDWSNNLEQAHEDVQIDETVREEIEDGPDDIESARSNVSVANQPQALEKDREPLPMFLGGLYTTRWIGLVFLILSAIDFGKVLIGLEFKNPASELAVVSALTSHTPYIFLGLALIFWGGTHQRLRVGRIFVGFLSWLTLLAGIVYLGLIPPMIIDHLKIDNQLDQQQANAKSKIISTWDGRQRSMRAQMEEPEKLQLLKKRVLGEDYAYISDQQAKKEVVYRMKKQRKSMLVKLDSEVTVKKKNLLHSTISTIAGLTVLGVAFIGVWLTSRWARKIR